MLWRENNIEDDPLRRDAETLAIDELEDKLVLLLTELLNIKGADQRLLHNSAEHIRNENVGAKIDVRGVIELSNVCRANCVYCPMRVDNLKLNSRSRISSDAIIEGVRIAHDNGIHNLFLQSGEDPKVIPIVVSALQKIKKI